MNIIRVKSAVNDEIMGTVRIYKANAEDGVPTMMDVNIPDIGKVAIYLPNTRDSLLHRLYEEVVKLRFPGQTPSRG